MDTDMGNLVGVCESEREALNFVWEAAADCGDNHTDDRVPGREDANGHTTILAEGRALLEIARCGWAARARQWRSPLRAFSTAC